MASDQPPSSETLTEEQQLTTEQILWNEDWLARQLWMVVINTTNAYQGAPILSEDEWLPTWKDKLSAREREMWKAGARLAQTLFQRLLHVELHEARTEVAELRIELKQCEDSYNFAVHGREEMREGLREARAALALVDSARREE